MFWLNCSAWVGNRSTSGAAQEPEDRHDRVGGDLEALETHVDRAGRVPDQRRREATAELGRHEQGDLGVEVLGEQPDVVAELVHRHPDVLPEEVAAVVDGARLAVDQRVVRGRVDLRLDLAGDRREALDDRSDELRQAAHGVAVLDRPAAARRSRPRSSPRVSAEPASRARIVCADHSWPGCGLWRWMNGSNGSTARRQRLDRQGVRAEGHHELGPRVVHAQRGDTGHGRVR